MTHFVRYAMIGAMVAGASVCALAQTDDIDNLLDDIGGDVNLLDLGGDADAKEPNADEKAPEKDTADEPAAEPEAKDAEADQPADEPAADPAAEPEAKDDEAPEAEEPTAEPEAAEPEVTQNGEAAGLLVALTKDEVSPQAPAVAVEMSANGEAVAMLPSVKAADTDIVRPEDRMLNELEKLEELRQKGLDKHAADCLKKAKELMDAPPPAGKEFEHYKAAIEMYRNARKYAREMDANIPLRVACEKGIRDAKYRQAVALFEADEYARAMDLAQTVAREGEPKGEALAKAIQDEVNKPADIRPEPVLPEYAKESYKAKRTEIADRLRRATVYYQVANYKEANDQVELILRDDPGNEAAISLRARINRRASASNRALKASQHDWMISQVEANWTPLGSLGTASEELYNPVASKGSKMPVGPSQGEKESAAVMEKLNYIRLPEFSIRPPSTLADAVALFAEMSKAYDKPELPPEEKGVAFVLNVGAGKKAAAAAEPAAEEDPFAAAGGEESSGAPAISAISMTYVTLKEALDMVCEVTQMSYIVKGKTVMIVPAGYVAGVMETRSYNVMASLMEKISGVQSELSASSGGDDGWGTTMDSGSSGAGAGTDADTIKKFFIDLGVPFSGEAKIAYLNTIGKLRVTNTPENLALLEGVLEELNVTPYQIEVEARFVEVSQADLNSLGFEWQLNSDIVGTVGSGIDWTSSAIMGNTNGGNAAGGFNPNTGTNGMNVFRPDKSPNGTGDSNVAIHGGKLNQGMRFLGDGSAYANRINLANSVVAPNDEFLTMSAVFGKMDVTMILHMLAQRTDTDMLSSPKVLARPGQEAMIRVVTEWIYPTEFDITELEADDIHDDNNNWPMIPGLSKPKPVAPPVKFAVEPQSFEKQEVGVSLTVVPEVSQEGQMINLLINPKVVEYLGDFNYGMKVPYYDNVSEEILFYLVDMPQPKFHFREINTYLSVYNGSTVVMGGLITENRRSFEDKVPLLGDLPFIGFLFRSTGEFSEKRNLLIFLTARLVDPAGRPLKTATDGRTGDATIDRGNAEGASTMGTAAAK